LEPAPYSKFFFSPGAQGFIVPNEKGRTNVLDRYLNSEITITLPEGKRIAGEK